MTFPVNGAIPGPNDLLSQSQSQIQTNFNNIVGWSGVDHVAYGSTNAGIHNQVTLSALIGSPYAATGTLSYTFAAAGTSAGSQLTYQPTVTTSWVPVSARAFGRLKYNGTSWALDGSSLSFNAASGSGASGEPTLSFSSAFSNTLYFVFAQYEASGATSVAAASKSTGSVQFSLITSFRSVAMNDTIGIWIY